MVRTQNEDDTHTSVMQKLKEQKFEQFSLGASHQISLTSR
jgi:hypothetical protein